MGQVPEPQCGAAEMLEAAVDRFRRAVADAGVVEEREDVARAALGRPSEGDQLWQILRDAARELGDDALEDLLPRGAFLVPVGGHGALVEIPGDLDGDIIGMRVEHRLELRELGLLQQPEPRPEQTAATVERVAGAAAVPEGLLLDTLAGLVERIAEQLNDMERVHHRRRVGDLFACGGLVAGEAIHRDDIDAITPGLGASDEPGLKTFFDRSGTMSSSRAGPVLFRAGARSMMTVTYLSPRRV